MKTRAQDCRITLQLTSCHPGEVFAALLVEEDNGQLRWLGDTVCDADVTNLQLVAWAVRQLVHDGALVGC